MRARLDLVQASGELPGLEALSGLAAFSRDGAGRALARVLVLLAVQLQQLFERYPKDAPELAPSSAEPMLVTELACYVCGKKHAEPAAKCPEAPGVG